MRNDPRRWLAHNDDLPFRAVGEQRVEFDGKRMPTDRAETRKLICGHRRDVVKPEGSVSIPLSQMEVALAAKARVKVIADRLAACLWEVVKKPNWAGHEPVASPWSSAYAPTSSRCPKRLRKSLQARSTATSVVG